MKKFDVHSIIRANIRSLKPYSSARDEFTTARKEVLFFDANENPFENGVNRYPDPLQQKLKIRLQDIKGISADQIFLGNGSDEVLDLIIRAFCEPGMDNIITLPPTYGMYGVLASINNVENRKVVLTSNFEIRVEEVLKTVDQNSKIIFLCSPNNPTGNSFSIDSIKAILDGFRGIVVVDEAYIDFSGKESWLSKIESNANLVVTHTLSKAFGMAGIRLGMAFASKEIISVLNKIKPPYNVNELTQQRALVRLLEMNSVRMEIARIGKEKERLLKELPTIKYIAEVFRTDANFILCRVDNATKRYKQLLHEGIVVRDRSNQPLCENALRITIGTEDENTKLLSTLKKIQD